MFGRPTHAAGLILAAALGPGCRASCNFDLNLLTCESRFTGTRLVAHGFADGLDDRNAVSDALVAARGDAELGVDWAVTRVDDTVVLGFPDAGAVGTLPLFTEADGCPATTTRALGYIEDATVARQPRLRVQVGSCTDDEDVLFTGPGDFGSRILPWAREDGGWDLWVAAPREGLSRGAVWRFDGAAERAADERSHDTAEVALEGDAPGDLLGDALVRCGDLDGDGADELAIGATGWSTDGTPTLGGAVLMVSPSTMGESDSPVAAASAILWGADGDRAGSTIACDHDVDGDGVLDVVVGAPSFGDDERGAVFVVSAGALEGSGALADRATTRWEGTEEGGRAGTALQVVDLDADGVGEIIVGIPGSRLEGEGTGSAAVLRWTPDSEWAAAFHTGREGLSVNGVRAAPRMGTSVASVDLDQDGLPELIAAAWRADRDGSSLHAGELRLWSGSLVAEGLGAASPAAVEIRGEGPHQQVGRQLSIFDIDGDGVPEILTGAMRQAR